MIFFNRSWNYYYYYYYYLEALLLLLLLLSMYKLLIDNIKERKRSIEFFVRSFKAD